MLFRNLIGLIILAIVIHPLKILYVHIYPINSSFLPTRTLGKSNIPHRLFYNLKIHNIEYSYNKTLIIHLRLQNIEIFPIKTPIISIKLPERDTIYYFNACVTLEPREIKDIVIDTQIILNSKELLNNNVFLRLIHLF